MFVKTLSTALVVASVASAHFSITSPEMRGDPFASTASEWIYPCANVNQTASTNRTLWPIAGGSLDLDLHHPWTYVFINLGLGTDYPSFNISLTAQPLNETGNGTLCLPQVLVPSSAGVTEGQNASLQVVTVGKGGSALYTCSDITFSSNATLLSGDACTNSTGVSVSVLNQQINGSTTTTTSNATTTVKSAGNSIYSHSIMTGGLLLGLGVIVFSSWI